MIAFIMFGLWGVVIIAGVLSVVMIFLLALDGRAALSLLNAKEQLSFSRAHKILANVSFRVGVSAPLLYETSRFPNSIFFIQSSFHRGWLVVGQEVKKRLSDEELEIIFARVALRKKIPEYKLMVPLSSLLLLLNLPIFICEKYRWARLRAFVCLFWAPHNAMVAKLSQRSALSQKVEELYAQNMGERPSLEALSRLWGANTGSSLYQTLCLQPLSLRMLAFEDPFLRVLFSHYKVTVN